MTNYGQQIRQLADQYAELTGSNVFQGVEHRGRGAGALYLFSDATYDNGPEALGHMRELLRMAESA